FHASYHCHPPKRAEQSATGRPTFVISATSTVRASSGEVKKGGRCRRTSTNRAFPRAQGQPRVRPGRHQRDRRRQRCRQSSPAIVAGAWGPPQWRPGLRRRRRHSVAVRRPTTPPPPRKCRPTGSSGDSDTGVKEETEEERTV
ncbi:unnamed protein product, partial [Ixodes pacificus]